MSDKQVKVSFWLPRDVVNQIKDRLHNNAENLLPKYLYPIHKLYHEKLNRRGEYQELGIRLNAQTLSRAIGFNNPSKILNDLIKWGYIKRVQGYVSGCQSYSYKLSPYWEKAQINRVPIASTRRNDFIFKLKHAGKSTKERFSIVKYQREIFEKHVKLSYRGKAYLRYRYPRLSTIIDAYPNNLLEKNYIDTQFDQTDILLLKFLFGEYFVKRTDKSRLYSNLTSLKTEFRQFVLIDDKPIINTDLTNSQVLFGCFVIENHLKKANKNRLPQDFIKFKELSTQGKIYDYIAGKAELTDMLAKTRKEFKQKFFREVWYSRVHKKRTPKLYKVFKNQFPSVARAIADIKKDDYTKFPVELQNLEAKMMLDIIGIQLKKSKITFLTIHDSFSLNNIGDLKRTESLISDYFQKEYAVKPHFKNDYEELSDVKTLPYHKRFKPAPLYLYHERDYEIDVKCGYAKKYA